MLDCKQSRNKGKGERLHSRVFRYKCREVLTLNSLDFATVVFGVHKPNFVFADIADW